jgi:hypothetical protein
MEANLINHLDAYEKSKILNYTTRAQYLSPCWMKIIINNLLLNFAHKVICFSNFFCEFEIWFDQRLCNSANFSRLVLDLTIINMRAYIRVDSLQERSVEQETLLFLDWNKRSIVITMSWAIETMVWIEFKLFEAFSLHFSMLE